MPNERHQPSCKTAIGSYYSHGGLRERIRDALVAGNLNTKKLSVDDLAALDSFHTGGRKATLTALEMLPLRPGLQVLDVGCGIGGTARRLAVEHGCDVTAIDLSRDYIEAAIDLGHLVEGTRRCRYLVASASQLPVAAHLFDALTCFHVSMNIADRTGLYTEFARVLRPGGHACLFDVMRTTGHPLHYPLPWAGDEGMSVLYTVGETVDRLQRSGFTVTAQKSLRAFAIRFFHKLAERSRMAEDPPPLGIHLLTGSNTREKFANYRHALEEGDLDPVIITAISSGSTPNPARSIEMTSDYSSPGTP